MKTSAILSPCRKYRYVLSREWDQSLPYLLIVGLNPSTADEDNDDPTIRRCIGFASSWGYGGLKMVNLFAYRATLPREMVEYPEPIGEENDRHIMFYAQGAGMILAAWGNNGGYLQRDIQVMMLLSDHDVYCLDVTTQGQPWHPLYVKGSTWPRPYHGRNTE